MKCQKDLSPLTTMQIREASPRFNKKIQLNIYSHGYIHFVVVKSKVVGCWATSWTIFTYPTPFLISQIWTTHIDVFFRIKIWSHFLWFDTVKSSYFKKKCFITCIFVILVDILNFAILIWIAQKVKDHSIEF